MSLALLLWSRWQQLSDPGYSIFETQPAFASFLSQFAWSVGFAYVGLLLFYIGLGLRK